MAEKIKLTVPNEEKNITLIRMATSFIASQMDFDIEAIEDLRVCVSEACNIQLGTSEKLRLTLEDKTDALEIHVEKKKSLDVEEGMNRELAASIMEILMDEVKIDNEGVHLIKYLRVNDHGETQG
ncbi:hypothetical protein ACTQ46_09935 [Gallicola sp. Sow4_E12]|uniref:hypothetical protein n=1 Tax=Gallicola sp. Sow4_E12 TaxID=3438785 RepID=UPI003F8FED51